MTYYEQIASRVKELRLNAGISSDAVANFLNMHKSSYSKLENGKTQLTVEIIKQLGAYFNKPVFYFFADSASVIQITHSEGNNINSVTTNLYQNIDPEITKAI